MKVENFDGWHRLYCVLTGREMPLTMPMIYQWQAWKAHGWSETDLRLVVSHIKALIQAKRRFPESLRFYNVIGNCDMFQEHLSEARALSRRPPPTPRQAVLRATGRQEQDKDRVVSAGQALERLKLAQSLKQWREAL